MHCVMSTYLLIIFSSIDKWSSRWRFLLGLSPFDKSERSPTEDVSSFDMSTTCPLQILIFLFGIKVASGTLLVPLLVIMNDFLEDVEFSMAKVACDSLFRLIDEGGFVEAMVKTQVNTLLQLRRTCFFQKIRLKNTNSSIVQSNSCESCQQKELQIPLKGRIEK